MTTPRFSKKNILLCTSLLGNAVLIFLCVAIFSSARSFYTDYRHFRALGIGTSEATLLDTSKLAAGQRIVMYGDSRIENWKPAPTLPRSTFINAGINGETTTEMRRRFENDVLRHQPDVVIIQAGTNDLTASITRGIRDPQKLVDEMHSNMEYFVTELAERNITVVLTSVFPNNTVTFYKRFFWHDTLIDEIEISNARFQKLANNPGVHWLDLSTVFYSSSGKVDSSLYIDTLHLNRNGYREVNTRLHDLLLQLDQP